VKQKLRVRDLSMRLRARTQPGPTPRPALSGEVIRSQDDPRTMHRIRFSFALPSRWEVTEKRRFYSPSSSTVPRRSVDCNDWTMDYLFRSSDIDLPDWRVNETRALDVLYSSPDDADSHPSAPF
jgi:hypothetical protein